MGRKQRNDASCLEIDSTMFWRKSTQSRLHQLSNYRHPPIIGARLADNSLISWSYKQASPKKNKSQLRKFSVYWSGDLGFHKMIFSGLIDLPWRPLLSLLVEHNLLVNQDVLPHNEIASQTETQWERQIHEHTRREGIGRSRACSSQMRSGRPRQSHIQPEKVRNNGFHILSLPVGEAPTSGNPVWWVRTPREGWPGLYLWSATVCRCSSCARRGRTDRTQWQKCTSYLTTSGSQVSPKNSGMIRRVVDTNKQLKQEQKLKPVKRAPPPRTSSAELLLCWMVPVVFVLIALGITAWGILHKAQQPVPCVSEAKVWLRVLRNFLTSKILPCDPSDLVIGVMITDEEHANAKNLENSWVAVANNLGWDIAGIILLKVVGSRFYFLVGGKILVSSIRLSLSRVTITSWLPKGLSRLSMASLPGSTFTPITASTNRM